MSKQVQHLMCLPTGELDRLTEVGELTPFDRQGDWVMCKVDETGRQKFNNQETVYVWSPIAKDLPQKQK